MVDDIVSKVLLGVGIISVIVLGVAIYFGATRIQEQTQYVKTNCEPTELYFRRYKSGWGKVYDCSGVVR